MRPEEIDVIEFLNAYCEANGWPTTENDRYEVLLCEDEVTRFDIEDEDHFVYYTVVVQVAGQFVKFETATAKDNSEHEFQHSSIEFVEKKIVETITYG